MTALCNTSNLKSSIVSDIFVEMLFILDIIFNFRFSFSSFFTLFSTSGFRFLHSSHCFQHQVFVFSILDIILNSSFSFLHPLQFTSSPTSGFHFLLFLLPYYSTIFLETSSFDDYEYQFHFKMLSYVFH
jgi:hypothetical protein